MSSPPSRIPEADWQETPTIIGIQIPDQQQEIQALRKENNELRCQLTALASEMASLR